MALRDQLSDVRYASGASVHDVVQASVDLLMFTIIRAAPHGR
jgi:hypothetical protein